jgi:AraC family transcriptional regulator, positive regulator of tynA and feaB
MMHANADLLSASELNYEQWRDALRPNWGLYTPHDPKTFVGRVRSQSIWGFNAANISNNVARCERTQRDIRLDGVDHYYAVFQTAGRSTIVQNDRTATRAVGDVALIDSARPVTYLNDGREQWLSLQLPRQPLVSHLRVEPQDGFCGRARTGVGRLLYQLIRESLGDENSMSAPAGYYMQLAVYDLLGALFVPSNPVSASLHNDKLFSRVCNIIRDRLSDPDFGPCEVAIEAGISLRYLQKLFTQRSSTCSEFIYSLRLDHASRLLHRRKLLSTGQPISEIAYASGFRDYTNFARKFRRRFGRAPAFHTEEGV